MAASATTAWTLDQYLSTNFNPDLEYIEGVLQQKPAIAPLHGRVQALLVLWFGRFEEELSIQSAVEARTQVAPNRVRLPDFALMAAGRLPSRALATAPLLAIEVLAETDKPQDLAERARDLARMGSQAVWLLDLERQQLSAWSGQAWVLIGQDRPMTPAGAPLDLPWLWAKLAPSR